MKNTYLLFLSLIFLLVAFTSKETVKPKQKKEQPSRRVYKPSSPNQDNGSPSSCPASPYPITVKQPDGSTITIIGKGTMAKYSTETIDGYTVVKNRGYYEYATDKSGKIEPSGIVARDSKNRNTQEKQFLQSIPKSLGQSATTTSSENKHSPSTLSAPQNVSFPSTGTRKTILILIKYPDMANTYTSKNFEDLMNLPNYNGTGSFKDFYKTSSFGKLDLSTDVFGWYTAKNNYSYYGNNNQATRSTELVREAIDAAQAAGVDFSKYDNDKDGNVDGVIIAHSGPGAEEGGNGSYIWSHRWVLAAGNNSVIYDGVKIDDYIINPETRLFSNSMVGIGVFCHEFGHNLGLPDLYDTSAKSEGIGNWCLMAGGAWLGSEKTPANMSAWCKATLNWISPTVLSSNGQYTLKEASGNSDCYRINTQVASEYFLIENRQKKGLDIALPGSGIAIWHINTIKTSSQSNDVNADRTFKGVDLEEADGLDQLDGTSRGDAGDLYPGTANNKTFNDSSLPNAKTYTGAYTGINIKEIAVSADGKSSFTFEDLTKTPPTITSFSPASASPGKIVNITGTNLLYINSVSFGGTAAKSFTVVSPTTVTAIISNGATGDVVVSSKAGSSSLSGFTYVPPPPPPVITSIVPVYAAVDSVITISGRNFGSGSSSNIVFFGEAQASVTSATSTTLKVKVPKGAAHSTISVTANSLTGYSSQNFSVLFPNKETSFNSKSFESSTINLYNSNSFSKAMVSADFNNDGLQDLALARGYDYSVNIYKNNGDSKQPFTAASLNLSTNYIQRLSVADFNGDGKLDLISISNSSIYLFQNTSTASTISFSSIYRSISSNGDVAVADFDGDGKPDIACIYNSTLALIRNNSENNSITFENPVNITISSPAGNLTAADLNNDENLKSVFPT